MPDHARRVLDVLIPAPWLLEQHLRELDSERDILTRLLDVSKDYERRREKREPVATGAPA